MNKKVGLAISGIVGLVVVWLVTYKLWGNYIDNQVDAMPMNEDYLEEVNVAEPVEITAHKDGVDYSIQDLAGLSLYAGDIIDVTIVYDNDEVVDTKAYVTYSTDISDKVVRYDANVEGSMYGRIVLPYEKE